MPREYEGAGTQTYRKLYGYKKIIAWQKADDLACMIHDLTTRFGPGYYRLADQMRGAAVSVKSNIAEGYCRAALGDYIRFCEIARGSLGELGSQIQDCERWGLITGNQLTELLEQFSDATFFLERLLSGLKKKQRAKGWDRSFGAKEAGIVYVAEDADQPFELPEEVLEELGETKGNFGLPPSSSKFHRVPLKERNHSCHGGTLDTSQPAPSR